MALSRLYIILDITDITLTPLWIFSRKPYPHYRFPGNIVWPTAFPFQPHQDSLGNMGANKISAVSLGMFWRSNVTVLVTVISCYTRILRVPIWGCPRSASTVWFPRVLDRSLLNWLLPRSPQSPTISWLFSISWMISPIIFTVGLSPAGRILVSVTVSLWRLMENSFPSYLLVGLRTT